MQKKASKSTFEAAHHSNDNLFVTQPDLPPLKTFYQYLEKIWERKWLTNNGLYHQELEKRLADFLGVDYVSLFSNGTLALVTALQVLRVTGEVITTPYSFVATTHALNWNGISPVFCDIEPHTMNMDPEKIESLITPKTTAILPVHIYGNPCDTERIQNIADIYGLYVIYDACHAFDVKTDGRSVLTHGDLSVLSFHATKIFTTMEGGAIVTDNKKLKDRIDYLKNFGFADEITVMAPGINGKMNEMQAALGLLQLERVERNIAIRKKLTLRYREALGKVPGIRFLTDQTHAEHNFAYFPIFIDEAVFGTTRDELYLTLKENNIYSRRYFFPLISEFPMYRGLSSAGEDKLPVATRISRQVITLPLYPSLKSEQQEKVIRIIKQNAKGKKHDQGKKNSAEGDRRKRSAAAA